MKRTAGCLALVLLSFAVSSLLPVLWQLVWRAIGDGLVRAGVF